MFRTIHFLFVRLTKPFELKVLAMCARWPMLAGLFFLFSDAFKREYRAVLSGRLIHKRDLRGKIDEGARYALRRSIHRLEKGLISRPLRAVFALDYIAQTVDLYAELTSNPSDGQAGTLLIDWARDVLHRYFEVAGGHPTIDKARAKFHAATHRPAGPCAPYKRDLAALNVTLDDMLALAKRRRSCRWYLQKPVPREMIDNAIRVAVYSPSACNRQPFEYRIFDNPEQVEQVAALPGGTIGFAENFPCVLAMVGRLRAFPYDRDRHLIYIDVALSAMAFQFALEVQGLSSCCINWPDVRDREAMAREVLRLEPDERIVMMMSLGFPDPEGMVPFSQKKSLDEIRSYNRL